MSIADVSDRRYNSALTNSRLQSVNSWVGWVWLPAVFTPAPGYLSYVTSWYSRVVGTASTDILTAISKGLPLAAQLSCFWLPFLQACLSSHLDGCVRTTSLFDLLTAWQCTPV